MKTSFKVSKRVLETQCAYELLNGSL